MCLPLATLLDLSLDLPSPPLPPSLPPSLSFALYFTFFATISCLSTFTTLCSFSHLLFRRLRFLFPICFSLPPSLPTSLPPFLPLSLRGRRTNNGKNTITTSVSVVQPDGGRGFAIAVCPRRLR